MNKLILGLGASLLLAATSFADILITEAEVTNMNFVKRKGSFVAPGSTNLESVVLKVTDWKQGEKSEGDDKVIEMIESGNIQVEHEWGKNMISSGFMPNHNYKFLRSHRLWFTNKTRVKLKVTGSLNYDKGHDPHGHYKGMIVILKDMTYTSRKGTMTCDERCVTEKANAKRNFDALYDGE
ncbi:MAG: hypothetical protein KC646_08305 [Candidatus Cloacimonetes bacterium]|nr:hypothetical protein [Candidatus Cloacimonadota bacterium]